MNPMLTLIIPLVVLVLIIACKPIPKIGGNIRIALLVGAALSMILGGVYNPVEWGTGLITGLNKLAWVMALSLVGSIYAETQVQIGTMQTVLEATRARFGHKPKNLIAVVVFVLVLAGSLLGESIATAVIVGTLIIKNLEELELKPEHITSIIVMAATCGSIMPPISVSGALAAGLAGLTAEQTDAMINWSYLTIGVAFILIVFYTRHFCKIDKLPESLIPELKSHQILAKNWKSLIPISILAIIIILRSGFKLDLLTYLDPIFLPISNIPVILGFNYVIVRAILIALVVTLFFKVVRNNFGQIVVKGCKNVKSSLSIQFCAACLVGAFYTAGQVEAVTDFAVNLNADALIIGGCAMMMLIGMVTGSLTTSQTVIFSVLAPAMIAVGIDPVNVAVAGSHWSMAGQGFPPADAVTFVVAGLVTAVTGKDVNVIKSMCISSFFGGILAIIGLIFAYM